VTVEKTIVSQLPLQTVTQLVPALAIATPTYDYARKYGFIEVTSQDQWSKYNVTQKVRAQEGSRQPSRCSRTVFQCCKCYLCQRFELGVWYRCRLSRKGCSARSCEGTRSSYGYRTWRIRTSLAFRRTDLLRLSKVPLGAYSMGSSVETDLNDKPCAKASKTPCFQTYTYKGQPCTIHERVRRDVRCSLTSHQYRDIKLRPDMS